MKCTNQSNCCHIAAAHLHHTQKEPQLYPQLPDAMTRHNTSKALIDRKEVNKGKNRSQEKKNM